VAYAVLRRLRAKLGCDQIDAVRLGIEFHRPRSVLCRDVGDHREHGGRRSPSCWAEIGFFRVLHTRNQRLLFHPHVHCVLAAGGLAPDHSGWISSSRRFFLPIKVLSRVFRGKYVAGLRTAFNDGSLRFHHSLLRLVDPRRFAAWLRTLFPHEWVVYAKRPLGGPAARLALSRCLHSSRRCLQPQTRCNDRGQGLFSLV